jgi:hypothetical protein
MRPTLILLILAFPFACGAAQSSGPEWKEFVSKPGGFRVLLPGVPREQKQTTQTPAGAVVLTLFLLELQKGRGTYGVGYSELAGSVKPGTWEKRLEKARDQAVARAHGKLRADRRITLQGSPGREFEIEVDGKLLIRTRMFAANNRLYQVLAIGPSVWLLSRETTQFLDSFRLKQ